MAGQKYKPIGEVIEYTTKDGPLHTPVVVCKGCGAVVADVLQADHDEFHAGLADLWEARSAQLTNYTGN